jgi:hypothetical protein
MKLQHTSCKFYIIFTIHFLTTHKLHTNEIHYIFTFYSLTPTYVSAFTNVDYEPPEDGLVKAETYVGVKE